jgi:hypothetical protein
MSQTKAARLVLADCAVALSDYSQGPRTDLQRTRWLAVITLLRAVLDVLEKVDGRAGSRQLRNEIKKARANLFKTKPEPRIFHEFVEDERNDTVHQYVIRARVNVRIDVPGGPWMPAFVGRHGDTRATNVFEMRDGPFKGQDPRVLCRQAIEFWRDYLDRIDEQS